MRTNLVVAVAAAGMLFATVPASAHHAFAAEFDAKKPVHYEGTVTKVELINPHTWIHVDVKNPDGTVTNWMFEAGSPNVLLRRGFTKETIKPGTAVVVDGYQSKDGSFRANGRDITLPDGRKLFLGSSGTGAPDEKPSK
jgi:DNA/RNA endonuclease YhcR with UshA esterase domain